MLFKSIFIALLATSTVAFNGQAPASFASKTSQSETVLKMAGGNVAPALKVRARKKAMSEALLFLIFGDFSHFYSK